MLIYTYRSLEATLNELRQYKRQHDEWAALLNKILAEQASLESRIESRMGYEEFRMRQSKTGKGKAIQENRSSLDRYVPYACHYNPLLISNRS